MTRGEVLDQLTQLADRLADHAERQREEPGREPFDPWRAGARHGFDISARDVRALAAAVEATWRVDEGWGP